MAGSVKSGPGLSLGQQLVMVFGLAFLLLPLAGSRFVGAQIAKQQSAYPAIYGEPAAQRILDRGDLWFRRLFVDTGVIAQSLADAPAPGRVPTASGAGEPAQRSDPAPVVLPGPRDSPAGDKLIKHWLGGAWSILYFGLLRLSALVSVLPLLVPVVIAILVDGETRRKLKWTAFGGADPKRFVVGARLAGWCSGLAAVSVFSPGALPVLTTPVLIVMGALGGALWTANQQKPV